MSEIITTKKLIDFYVYTYTRLDTGKVFYVGKGRGRRAYSLSKRNKYFKSIVDKTDFLVNIVYINLSEDEAFSKEKELIKFYREQDIHLANMTDGGEGLSGYIQSEETRKKISKSLIGNKYSLGYKHTNETKQKMSRTRKGRPGPNKGKTASEETKKRMSIKRKGRKPNLGKKHSAEAIRKMIASRSGCNNPNSKKVIDISSGFIFDSIKEAAVSKNINYGTLRDYLINKYPNKTSLRYVCDY